MFVGVMKLGFHLPGARSLKDKRMVVRSFRDRVRARFDVSIAEIEHQDLHQRATFGVAVVSSDAGVCDEVLTSVASLANGVRDALLVDRKTEIMTIGELHDDAALAIPSLRAGADDEDDEPEEQ
jgi:uncharacterized protein YlxP (DUF503 family)